ncbi:MAG TPA: DUF3368 domain-containing protein [Verrucomicrobiae bacterium]
MPANSPIVSDSSVIVFLAAIRQFDLLRQLYSQLLIPDQVFHEVADANAALKGAAELRAAVSAGWIIIKHPSTGPLTPLLTSELDAGEAAAILLALETGATTILIDDAAGRRAAVRLGLKPAGTLGILLAAKNAGKISALKPLLDSLRTEHSFHISEALAQAALSAAGEA